MRAGEPKRASPGRGHFARSRGGCADCARWARMSPQRYRCKNGFAPTGRQIWRRSERGVDRTLFFARLNEWRSHRAARIVWGLVRDDWRYRPRVAALQLIPRRRQAGRRRRDDVALPPPRE